ncbi:MAG TPA: 50S ribosomal protein L11 methyltransferase [Gaiellaceae bacterium]|nr:50S ribosomal protein L11 methyltransferase [Gaiellaceae bacterium]
MPESDAEIARARLLEIVPGGFEEIAGGAWVEFAAYTNSAGEARIRDAFSEVVVRLVASGWEDRWRAFHRPVHVAGLWIGPPWEWTTEAEPAVVVDPGRAFGTGAHPTTRACIELLARLERGRLLDAGCGSGVVAVAASRLGYAPVLGLDADPVAVEVARATAHRNDVDVEVRRADVLVDEIGEADVVVANIELGVVEALLHRRSAPTAVTSGYLAREAPRAAGWARVSRLELEGWAADVLVAK